MLNHCRDTKPLIQGQFHLLIVYHAAVLVFYRWCTLILAENILCQVLEQNMDILDLTDFERL